MINVLEVMSFNKAEREDYENHLKLLQIQTNTIRNYELKGKARGIKKIAINMLKANKPINEISELTGLSIATIESLKDEL